MMVQGSQSPKNWDLDSDEIASVLSDDLHEHRPNRWTGPKSTWRHFTKQERITWRSMRQLVDQDLAVHLYDAFALKRQGRDPSACQLLTIKTDDGQEAIWTPPKAWTAWPLQDKHVPSEGLFKDEKDGCEAYTLRKREVKMPSTDLQHELAATVLRLAKERYRRRKRRTLRPSIEAAPSPAGSNNFDIDFDVDGKADESSDTDHAKIESGLESESESESDADISTANEEEQQDLEPSVSTNDELSYRLLLPSVRHILAQLDSTLAVLHHARVAGLSHLSDPDSSTEDSDAAAGAKVERRSTMEPRHADQANDQKALPRRRRGRPPRTHVPQDGETQEQMRRRIARESHRRLPPKRDRDEEDDDNEGDEEDDEEDDDKDAAFKAWLREGDVRIRRRQEQEQEQEQEQQARSQPFPRGQAHMASKLGQWGLRDWSDVLGAAALAGFPEHVIARSARRCANLFGQGMTMRTLHEGGQSPRSGSGVITTKYLPERMPSSRLDPVSDSDDSDRDADATEAQSRLLLLQRRIASRQASLKSHTSSSSPSSSRRSRCTPSDGTPRQRSSRSRSASSASASASAGPLFCPVPSCARAAKGFPRRANLKRHLALIHPGHLADQSEADSEDEMLGAVHVDGFLRPIHPGRGWRGEDGAPRKRKRFYGGKSPDKGVSL